MRWDWAAAALLLSCSASAADRVVTLAPHLAELVCEVDACDRLVGVVAHTDEPVAAKVPRIGDAFAVNPEVVLALRPDLVLAWRGGTSAQLVSRLQALRIPIQWIEVTSLDGVAQGLLQVGAALSSDTAAQAAAARYRARLQALRQRYAGRAPLRVLYQIEVQPVFTVNRRSPISEAIALCGGQNVFAGMAALSGPVGLEAVLAADPQAIVFGKQEQVAQIRALWARWPQLAAVRAGNLESIDASRLTRQSPRLLEGVAELCEALDAARGRLGLRPAAS